MKTITLQDWNERHEDFRGVHSREGKPYILENRDGGTVSVPVKVDLPGYQQGRFNKFIKRGAPFLLDGQKVFIRACYDSGVVSIYNPDTQESQHVLFADLDPFKRPYFDLNHTNGKPMPGDIVTNTETDRRAVVESSMFEAWEGETFVCFGYMPPFCDHTGKEGRAVLSISGGPCRTLPTDKFELVGQTELTCWNWGNNGAGADQGVRYSEKVKHFEISI